MTRTQTPPRLLERHLAIRGGWVPCPRGGPVSADACTTCPSLCRREAGPPAICCSYPFDAADTHAARGRRREAVRIALGHRLERT